MHKTTRPFIHSLQTLLQNRLPADEYRQIMEESQWEYEKLLEAPDRAGSIRSEAYARFCSLCVSFYRAMLSVGMERRTAAGTIADASSGADWSPVGIQDTAPCPLARYFHAKDALSLCEATFCRRCPKHLGCPSLAELKSLKRAQP